MFPPVVRRLDDRASRSVHRSCTPRAVDRALLTTSAAEHSGSWIAALATAAASASPVRGGVLAIVAATVAYSRLHVGAHRASDILGGSVLDVPLALAVSALVASRRDVPRTRALTEASLWHGSL